GRGIPRDMLLAIFEPFRQVRGGDGSIGLGIGLSLCKRFVELHGGTIEAKSDGAGKGSQFVVRLPVAHVALLAEAPAAKHVEPSKEPVHRWNLRRPAVQATAPAQQGRMKRSVLIVDDNVLAANGIAKLLSHTGHIARTAIDAPSAMQVLAEFHPDIIFLDIGLPGESGYDLAPKIRRYLTPTPILVALTGYGQEEDKERALDAGFDHHLTKPVSITELEKVLAMPL
ncbi:MAG: response regulator, partial [bacterium]|nr:response regulator [bacterium]